MIVTVSSGWLGSITGASVCSSRESLWSAPRVDWGIPFTRPVLALQTPTVSVLLQFHSANSASVTAPRDALVTVWAYLARTPRV
jgi:hypothetical protein